MDQIALHSHWSSANRKMVAKLISELAYEQAFKIEENPTDLSLTLTENIHYHFSGKRNIWGQVVIEPSSLIRKDENGLDSDIL